MKCYSYAVNTPSECEYVDSIVNASQSDAAKKSLSAAEAAAISSLTGCDLSKAVTKLGILKSDFASLASPVRSLKGDKVVISECGPYNRAGAAEGRRFSIFPQTAAENAPAAVAAELAPVIIPDPPAESAPAHAAPVAAELPTVTPPAPFIDPSAEHG